MMDSCLHVVSTIWIGNKIRHPNTTQLEDLDKS